MISRSLPSTLAVGSSLSRLNKPLGHSSRSLKEIQLEILQQTTRSDRRVIALQGRLGSAPPSRPTSQTRVLNDVVCDCLRENRWRLFLSERSPRESAFDDSCHQHSPSATSDYHLHASLTGPAVSQLPGPELCPTFPKPIQDAVCPRMFRDSEYNPISDESPA